MTGPAVAQKPIQTQGAQAGSRQPVLDVISARLSEQGIRLIDLRTLIQDKVDAVLGAEPPSPASPLGTNQVAASISKTGQLLAQTSNLSEVISQIQKQIERLGAL